MVLNGIQKQSSKQYFVKPVQKQPYADVLKEVFLKISHGRFPVNIAKNFKNSIFIENHRWLLFSVW